MFIDRVSVCTEFYNTTHLENFMNLIARYISIHFAFHTPANIHTTSPIRRGIFHRKRLKGKKHMYTDFKETTLNGKEKRKRIYRKSCEKFCIFFLFCIQFSFHIWEQRTKKNTLNIGKHKKRSKHFRKCFNFFSMK